MQTLTETMPKKTPQKRRSVKRCFITSSGASDLTPLLEYLRERDIRPLSPDVKSSPGGHILDSVGAAIRDADLVIGVLSGDDADQNVIFELGYAHGHNKSVVVIGPQGTRLPSHLGGFMFIPDGLANPQGLRFNLDLLTEAPEKHRRAYDKGASGQRTAQRNDVSRVIDEWRASSSRKLASQLERYVSELLRAAGASAVAPSQTPTYGADLAVWFDELYPAIGGPLLVEVKVAIDSYAAATQVRDQGHRYLDEARANCLLVLYDHGVPDVELNAKLGTPSLFFYSIPRFEESLKHHDGAEVIRALRNRIAHGVRE